MSYTAKHWTNPVNISADNMNELELGVQEAHEGIDRLEKIIPGLQSENNDILKELKKVTSGTSDAFNLLKDIQNTLESEPDLAEILKQNSENFLLKTSQPLTNIEKQQVLKNLGLNKYTFLEDIIVNGNQITNGILELKIPGIDTELNRNSQNAVTNYAIVKALETFGTPDLNRYMNIHNESTTAHSDIRELINSKASMSYVEDALKNIPVPDVSGQISDHNLDSAAHQDIRNLIENIDLSGYALIDHNHDGIYATITHSHNYSYYQRDTIDLSNTSIYDENKYYPCTSKIPVNGLYKLQVAVQLNSGTKPSWSTHDSGFTYNLSALLKANDWGVTNGTMIIFEDTYSHSSVKPGSLTQLTNSGNAVLWLRGGGKYFVFKDWNENWTIHTETTEIYSQTITPIETLPASQGEKISYASHTHNYLPLSGGKMTGPLTWKDGNALPRNESPKFILTIDDFVNGGTTKWVLLNDLKTALGVPTDYATSSHTHDDYLPLTAGEEKTITGNLYVKNSSGNGNIIVGNGSCLLGASTGNLAISPKAGGIIYLRPQGSTISTGALAIKNGVVYPAINNQVSLGDSSYTFNNIYGTTIYQNGKQVANKEDIPTIPDLSKYALTDHTHDYATPSYVDTAIANLVGSAPDALNTFEELAAALDNNKDILDTFALKTHTHDYSSTYAAKSHTHSNYATTSHTHDYFSYDSSTYTLTITF